MLHALLHRKLQRWLKKDPYAIEDLLTSVVLGSAWYAGSHAVLLAFLGRAIDEQRRSLEASLRDVTVKGVEFWPSWGACEVEAEDADADARAGDSNVAVDALASARSLPGALAKTGVAASQPEVVVELMRSDGTKCLVLIEAKLNSGKSSHATADGAVTDQLGKYWEHLRMIAAEREATPVAVIYVTTSGRLPHDDLAATQKELRDKGRAAAPLYWLSWRDFVGVVPDDAPLILKDCKTLLAEHWQLVRVWIEPWPDPPTTFPEISFRRRVVWPSPPAMPAAWTFTKRSPR